MTRLACFQRFEGRVEKRRLPPRIPRRGERKGFGPPPFETKRHDDAPRVGPTGLIEGHASLFGVVDAAGDEVMPGAFAASLARRGAAGVRMLWQHDPAEPVGVWLSVAESPGGLYVRGRLNLAVQRGRELAALVADGAVDGLSIGFKAERAARNRVTGARRLQRIDLWEVSLVTFPMLAGARVFAVDRAASRGCGGATGRGLAEHIRLAASVFGAAPDHGAAPSGADGASLRRVFGA